ncbi:MAG: UDP-3-O-(3-hydroxymyristoyl)glucosamine N-acyltransferase [Deltaproteobacteria bacterium]|nr:UDP-3-O-(3-hydroxymyristoyl)glucosamine N-acyltransferase [Deltaproteobacteria bacterium]
MACVKTLGEIAKKVGGRVLGDSSVLIRGVAAIEEARQGDITFLSNPRYGKYLKETNASAVVVSEDIPPVEGKNLLLTKNPYLAFAVLLKEFKPPLLPEAGVHPKAEIHPSARLGQRVSIGAYAVIEDGADIGDGAIIYPGVYIGRNVTIGEGTTIYSNVSVREGTGIGKRVIIHCNSVLGSDGFGYARDGGKYIKIPQTGTVRIGDDVEVGSCVTIDRATVGETAVGRGTKIDNLVQIAHNVRIGEDCVIVAQAGISGSTKVGRRVQIAGQAGLAGHIEIADDCIIGAKSGVTKDIREKGAYTGYPALPHNEWKKLKALSSKLPEVRKRLEDLERRLVDLEKRARESS